MTNIVRTRERRETMATRIRVLSIIVGVALGGIALSYWLIQGLHGPEYRELADNNRLRRFPIRAPRGIVYDRAGRPLAENVPSYNLLLEPEASNDVKKSLAFAAAILETDPAQLHRLLVAHRREHPVEPALIAENLTLAQVARFELAALEHPEFETDVQQLRLYRHREQTAHVLGYLAEAGPQDLATGEYQRGDMIGRRGIESQFEPSLRGKDGQRVVVVDSRGRAVDEFPPAQPTPGQGLKLAIDLDLQQTAQRMLQDKVGAVVALDPRNGEILAMASAPSYDPNLFARRLRADDWMRLVNDPLKPLQNRSVQNALSPGSTFKIVMGIAGLAEHVVTPDTRFFCPGSAVFYGRRFRCWKPEGHGSVDLRQAIKHSCDVYFYNVGQRLGIERIAKYARFFGFGETTGVDVPGEKAGLVPDNAWSRRVRKHQWYLGETISVAIGQGPLLVTPLQMAVMMAEVANGGRRPTPHLAEPGGPMRPALDSVPSWVYKPVHDGLRMVVDSGTGHAAFVPGLSIAGKTGTVQVVAQRVRIKAAQMAFEQRDHAWFVSFAPVDDPQLVVAVFIEHGGAGSQAAAPVAKGIYEELLKKRPDLRLAPPA
ncbi:MAG TPA: penicillin-binding protein 2 [Thermoanaerobaculia bacterium]|nr:penicillin-binding protein 2 [Thermoanaerobaculia bacterium]